MVLYGCIRELYGVVLSCREVVCMLYGCCREVVVICIEVAVSCMEVVWNFSELYGVAVML